MGETGFLKILLRLFCVGKGGMSKTAWPRFNAFSKNVNTVNLKFFRAHGKIYNLEKIQQAF